jgi:predicted PurR-regulated permease PerM
MNSFNNKVKQILLLALLIFLLFIVIRELRVFIPGILAAITFYILSRENYFDLVFKRKWRKGTAAFLFMFYYLLLLGVPIYLAITLVSPQLDAIMSDPEGTTEKVKQAVGTFQSRMGVTLFSDKEIQDYLAKLNQYIPSLLNSTANLVTNLVLMLFMLYYMLVNGKSMEQFLFRAIPLKDRNILLLATETKRMIRANALGIPIISLIQGAFATLGYFIFDVENFALWGLVTAIFAFFPVIGTMVVWVPIVLFMYANNENWQATGLLIYSLVVTGNVDYLARITLLRKMSNVHPVLTVLGVIVGLGSFGFIGLIFGPLLISYIVVIFKIYMSEFGDNQVAQSIDTAKK